MYTTHTGGIVVAYAPATGETRVRFSAGVRSPAPVILTSPSRWYEHLACYRSFGRSFGHEARLHQITFHRTIADEENETNILSNRA